MYSKFEVSVENFCYGQEMNSHLSSGQSIFAECRSDVKCVLEKYILPTGALDGDMMKEEWFKTQKYDVFLSHSHKDIGALSAQGSDRRFFLLSFLPLVAFWLLDSFYLQKENKEFYIKIFLSKKKVTSISIWIHAILL